MTVVVNKVASVVTFSDVLYILELNKNLISTAVLDSKGFETKTKNGIFTASFDESIYFVATKGAQGMFRLVLNNMSNDVLYVYKKQYRYYCFFCCYI